MIEEKQKKYIEFGRYLRKICKDDELFNWGLEYFKALQNIDFKLSKYHLDKVKIGNKTYEQDIVKELFKTREEVPIDELFLYQLKRNIKKIEYDSHNKKSSVAGLISVKSKLIKIINYKIYPESLEKYFYPSLKMPKYISTTKYNNYIKNSNNKITFFHELTHVLQIKTYQKNKFANFGNDFTYYNNATKNSEDAKITNIKNLNYFASEGSCYLNEIFNQYFTDSLDNSLKIENIFTTPNLQNTNYEEKFLYRTKLPNFLESFSIYLNNEHFLPFLTSIYGKVNLFDYNLKSNLYSNELNSYTCSPELKEKVIAHLTNNITDYVIKRNNETNDETDKNDEFEKFNNEDIPQMIKEYKNEISSFSNTNLINLFINERFKHYLTKYRFYENKQYFEAFALNLYRDKIKKVFDDSKIKKDGEYYTKINQHLTEIDKFLFGKWDKEVEYRDLRTGEKKIAPLAKVGSIQNLTNLYPNHLHYQEFNYLLHDLKKQIAKLPLKEQKEAVSYLSFLKKQYELNKNYYVIKVVGKKPEIQEQNENRNINKKKKTRKKKRKTQIKKLTQKNTQNSNQNNELML